jgi:hypothetical protein
MTRQIPVSAHPFQLGAPLVALEGDTACQKTEAPTSMAKNQGAAPVGSASKAWRKLDAGVASRFL